MVRGTLLAFVTAWAVAAPRVAWPAAAGGADSAVRPDQQAVLAAYRRMEEADRTGDVELWFALRDRKTIESMRPELRDAIRKGGRARPGVEYEVLGSRVQGSRAVVMGRVTDRAGKTDQHVAILFALEENQWKVAREQWSDKPFDPFVIHAMLPPEPGGFARDGSPWRRVAYAAVNRGLVRSDELAWKVQGTYDDTFLYVRYEALVFFPAPGSRVKPEAAKMGKTGGPAPPPPMRVKVFAGNPAVKGPETEYAITVTDLVSAAGGFQGGKAALKAATVTYALYVKNAAGEQVFEASLGDEAMGGLLDVGERYIVVKIPLAALGVSGVEPARITLEEGDGMMRVVPAVLKRYGGE